MDPVTLQIALLALAFACLFFERTSRCAAPAYFLTLSAVNLYMAGISSRGWDFYVFCNAGEAIRRGLNPYLIEHMKTMSDMPWTYVYPALTAFLFKPFCAARATLYPLLDLALFAATFALFVPRSTEGGLYLAAILSTGFFGANWNLVTGNLGILELFLLGLAFRLFRRSSFAGMGACLGAMSVFKILPLLFVPVAFLTKEGRRPQNAKRLLLGAILVFAGVQVASAVLFPGLFPWYLKQILGLIPEQESPASEFAHSDTANPAFLPSVRAWVAHSVGGHGIWVVFVVLLLYLFYRMVRNVSLWRVEDPEKVLAFGTLVAILCLPRLKPYSVIWAALPLCLMTMDWPWRWRSGVLFISCALPFAFALNLFKPMGVFAQFMWTCQTSCLFFAILLVYAYEWRRAVIAAKGLPAVAGVPTS